MSVIPDTVKIYGDVEFGKKCIVGEYSVIGYPYVECEKSFKLQDRVTCIGDGCIIGSHVVIYEGAQIGEETKVDDFCRIGEHVNIGKKCHILYDASLYGETEIGEGCVIAGFCCERAKLGNNVRLFGALLHTHREPHLGWDDVEEESPEIDDDVFIGFGASVIGGIKIGKISYIAAGAIVTKDVPSKSIVSGVNKIIHYKSWRGGLRSSAFFERDMK